MSATSASASGRRVELDHMGAYNFTVEIEGVNAGYFKGVDGLNAEIEVIENSSGDVVQMRKIPGMHKYSNITLKRGYVETNQAMEKWFKSEPKKTRTLSLVLFQNPTKKGKQVKGAQSKRLCAYTLHDARLKSVSQGEDGRQFVLVPSKVTHSCQALIKPPKAKAKAKK